VPDSVLKHQAGTDRMCTCKNEVQTEAVLPSFSHPMKCSAVDTRVNGRTDSATRYCRRITVHPPTKFPQNLKKECHDTVRCRRLLQKNNVESRNKS
jgi:hypothetical protein